jgi:hypothetical protein
MGVRRLNDDTTALIYILCLTVCIPSIIPSPEIPPPALKIPEIRVLYTREWQSLVQVMCRMLTLCVIIVVSLFVLGYRLFETFALVVLLYLWVRIGHSSSLELRLFVGGTFICGFLISWPVLFTSWRSTSSGTMTTTTTTAPSVAMLRPRRSR